jgi:guanylate kinase
MSKLYILDIDHTLTDPKDSAYDTPLDELFQDPDLVRSILPNTHVFEWLEEDCFSSVPIFLTGRSTSLLDVTEKWIRTHFDEMAFFLYARPDHIHYADTPKFKGDYLRGLLNDFDRTREIVILDDNPLCLYEMNKACEFHNIKPRLYLVDKEGKVNDYVPTKNIIVVSGPSGVGKTTLVEKLCERNTYLKRVITTSTRAPRGLETDGVDYHFVTREEFGKIAFVEHAEVHGEMYGTQLRDVMEILDAGMRPILILDTAGHETIRGRYPVLSIYIRPESLEVLKDRLENRGDGLMSIFFRLLAANADMKHMEEYDFVVTNDDFESAYTRLKEIIDGN